MSELALGTVQFGLDYGIKNSRGRVPEQEVKAILELASRRGVDTLDTAAAYGDSESVLGRTMGQEKFKVISKHPAKSRDSPRATLGASLERLRCGSLYGYLLHNFESWENDPGLLDQLAGCREAGLVKKIGVSLYRPEEAERLLDAKAPLDLVQVPYSVLDRRFERVFEMLSAYGTEIHVRSAFLQGVLFMPVDQLHPRFEPVKGGIEAFQSRAAELGVSIAALCLGFIQANPHVSRTVIGVDRLDDFIVNVDSFERARSLVEEIGSLQDISSTDESIILPQNWK